MRTGALIGYARVSTSGQLLDRQQHALAEADCLRVFADKLSGKDADRPELAARLDYLRPGDTLVVPSQGPGVPNPGRSDPEVTTPRRQGVGFKNLHGALDTTTPGGRLVFHVFAALAEFIRELIIEGTREGPDAARVGPSPVDHARPGLEAPPDHRRARDPLAVSLTGGQRHDVTQLMPLTQAIRQCTAAVAGHGSARTRSTPTAGMTKYRR